MEFCVCGLCVMAPGARMGDVMPQCGFFNPFLEKPAFIQASNTLSVFTFVLWGWLALTSS